MPKLYTSINLKSCITLTLVCLIISASISQDVEKKIDNPLAEIEALKIEIQKKTSTVLHIAKNASEESFDKEVNSTTFLKIINSNCGFYESQFDSEFEIYHPNLNEEFRIINEDDQWVQVRMVDGRNAWIKQDCGQIITKTSEKSLGRIKSINNKSDQLQLAKYIIDEIRLLVKVFEQKAKKLRGRRKTTESELAQINVLLDQVYNYMALAESAFLLYIIPQDDLVQFADFLSKVSFLGELQLGASEFAMVINESNKITQRGAIGDFLFDIAYRLNDKSAINLIFSNSNDIVQTPYSVTNVEANIKSKYKSLNWRSGISINKYNDEFNPFNKYNRLGLNVGAHQQITKKTTYNIDYLFQSNKYSEFSGINFSNHSINLRSRTIINSSKSISLNLRGNVQTGEEERRNFIFLNPELKYNVQNNKTSSQYFLNVQRYSFSNLGLRDSDRLMIGIRRNARLKNKTRMRYLAVSAKLFPSKADFNYYQLDSRFTTNWTKARGVYANTGIRVNYYPDRLTQSFADVQFSFGNNGLLFYNISTFNRLYYNIEPMTNILDLNIVTGLNIKRFKIGPSFSVHALMNLEEFEFSSDGNFYRLGAYAEGNLNLPYQINVSLNAAYDYGFVYSQQFEQDANTGDLTFGDLNERHPTTFQLNSSITTSIVSNTDLFLRVNMYIINTDITAAISRDPIQQNTRFLVRMGARYRFN